MGSSAPQFHVEPVMIAARTLDQIVADSGAKPGAIKIDVEGYEASVFLGATEVLGASEAPLIAFEFCDWAEERAFPGRRGWAQEILLSAGYRLWLLNDFLAGSASLGQPVREGFHTIVACKS